MTLVLAVLAIALGAVSITGIYAHARMTGWLIAEIRAAREQAIAKNLTELRESTETHPENGSPSVPDPMGAAFSDFGASPQRNAASPWGANQ